MRTFFRTVSVWKAALLLATVVSVGAAVPWFTRAPVDFNAQIKPLLNKHCLSCHGGVRRKGGFSLLTREFALAPNESGKPAIVPGHPEQSEMIRRLRCEDPEARMPYKEDPLDPSDIALLTRWIKEGAAWDRHWAYRSLEAPEVPNIKSGFLYFFSKENNNWVKNNIDNYIFKRLQQEHLTPAPEAGPQTLLQRVSLDLIGLPAPERLARQYLDAAEREPEAAYSRLVDSLLALPQYGERWAGMWLDIARYADTKGYERDDQRQIWRYRDWLIRAFNSDMPYDRFLTEQLAGDLLPNPTEAQYVATAFHRNTMTNDEGGTDNEEFRVAAVIDRVNTTWEGLMGTTFACVQCHSHPYDPFMQEEYYQFMAFFNNTRDEDTEEEYPLLRHFSGADSLSLLSLQGWLAQHQSPQKTQEIITFLRTWQPAFYSLAADSMTNCDLYDTKWLTMRHRATARFKQVNLDGKSRLIYRFRTGLAGGRWSVHLDTPDGPELFRVTPVNTKWATVPAFVDFKPVAGTHDLWFQYENAALKSAEEVGMGYDWFHFTDPLPGKEQADYAQYEKEFWRLLDLKVPTTPIMLDPSPDLARSTQVFERGNWRVKGANVNSGVPAHLIPFPDGAPRNRLGLAQWMCDPQHPLTARTMVNRVWEQVFGTGIAETLEDLGTQGIPPTHRELLDYLAWQFGHEHQWRLKSLLREIVTSATYRQDSKITAEKLAADPYNKYYGRGPRVRLSAEQIRDRALAVAGLLSQKLYGPSVMPYQPEGIWKSPWNGATWKKSDGEDQYRRALYTFLKRGAPYPSMMTFDGTAREVCAARRVRTNTPLQALVMLNDSVYMEAARFFARRLAAAAPNDVRAQIAQGYEKAIGHPITTAKLETLEALYRQALAAYQEKPAEAGRLTGEWPPAAPSIPKPGLVKTNIKAASTTATPPSVEQGELFAQQAALVIVANAILNLDEFVTKS